MKLGIVGFFAALVAAPLAAQAAEPPARFAVTLRATVSDKLSFDVTTSQEDCVTNRSGTGGRDLTIRSLRPTRIRVTAGPVYRPSRVGVLVVGGATGGVYKTIRRCRAGPFETTSVICKPNKSKPRPVRAAFRRSGRGALAFRGTSFESADACRARAARARQLARDRAREHRRGRTAEAELGDRRRKRLRIARDAARGQPNREDHAADDGPLGADLPPP